MTSDPSFNRRHSARPAPGLYIAATPIGNLADVTVRVIDTLKTADAILCEDTRHTGKLCAAYGVETPRRPYHEHNAAAVRPEIVKALQQGAVFCLVSDAGTPLISDPGYKLVADARAAGVDVFTLPGPCAAIAGLSAAGLPTDQFHFAGFPPAKQAARLKFYQDLATIPATLVFYEAANRLGASLKDAETAFGSRDAVIGRELTKRHEEFRSGRLADLAAEVATETVKGEIVLMIGPPAADAAHDPAAVTAFLQDALAVMSVKDAAAAAAEAFSLPRKRAYEEALALKRE